MNAETANPSTKPEYTFPDLTLATVDISRGRNLPRWETAKAIYHITLHLADSVPQEQLKLWRAERDRLILLARNANRPLSKVEQSEIQDVFNARVEHYLASGFGSSLLGYPEAAAILADVLEHSNEKLYSLHEWCIMPNHVHIIVGGLPAHVSLDSTIAIWKRVSSHAINKVLARSGEVWQKDAYTRIIRDADEYARQIAYVWHNPDSAEISDGFLRRRYVP